MQGGCLCENMPGLRVEFSNMEIAAAPAPRPQILVADTKDWTKTTLTMEGPAIEHIYRLFQEPENLRYVLFDFVHNYNQTSRQAVYQWFDRWLLNQPDQPVAEAAFQKEPDKDLVSFPQGKLPADAVSQQYLINYLVKMHRDQLQRLRPVNEQSLATYKRIMEPAWRRTMQLNGPSETSVLKKSQTGKADYISKEMEVVRRDQDQRIKLVYFEPVKSPSARQRDLIVLAHPDGKIPYVDSAGAPIGLARQFLDHGFDVVIPADAGRAANLRQTSIFFTTYNRTRLQERVGDLVSICHGVKTISAAPGRRVVLCGCGRAGLWSLLAAPAADAVIADCGQVDVSDDQALLDPDLFCPGIRNIDTFAGAALLAAPHPLVLHNMAKGFSTASLRAGYRVSRAPKKLKVESHFLTDDQIVAAALAL
ncbi:MAG TPA: hypothetical protein VFC44_10575, partial [Candidatus Saccharimonadales bacterium]|nr:hypothetical protein [Candidatus Saccharimonadales bacterium]